MLGIIAYFGNRCRDISEIAGRIAESFQGQAVFHVQFQLCQPGLQCSVFQSKAFVGLAQGKILCNVLGGAPNLGHHDMTTL